MTYLVSGSWLLYQGQEFSHTYAVWFNAYGNFFPQFLILLLPVNIQAFAECKALNDEVMFKIVETF